MCGTWRPDVRAVLLVSRWVALRDCPEGQNRIWHTDRLSRQTVGCFPGGRHIWKNWDLACSCLQSWLSLFFGTRGKHWRPLCSIMPYSLLPRAKKAEKEECFQLTWLRLLASHLSPSCSPGQLTTWLQALLQIRPIKGSVPIQCADLLHFTHYFSSQIYNPCIFNYVFKIGLRTVMISQV